MPQRPNPPDIRVMPSFTMSARAERASGKTLFMQGPRSRSLTALTRKGRRLPVERFGRPRINTRVVWSGKSLTAMP